MSLAEKFQITVPYSEKADDDGEKWQTLESARSTASCHDNPGHGEKFNYMPPGYDATCEYKDKFICGLGGDVDVSGGVTPESMAAGFKRREMKSTDDQYEGEHVDLFYGEAVDEKGDVGFAERNNYLDRI